MVGRTYCIIITWVIALAQSGIAASPGQVEITVAEMHCKGCGQKAAAQLYTVSGVKSVDVDVSRKTLVVVPQSGKTVSPRRLCEAIEQSGNRPVQLAGDHGRLVLAYSNPADRGVPSGNERTQVVVESMHCKGCAQKIASQLYTVSGVKAISVTVSDKTLYVTPVAGREVSLWAIWEAVKSANNRALEIRGPQGSLREAKSPKTPASRQHMVR